MEPFHIERFMFYQGRKLYGLVLRGYSRPGALEQTTDILARHGIDITYLSLGPVRSGERGSIILFLDFTEADVKPEELAEELEALEFIEEAEVIKPRFEGLIADESSFPIMLGSHRALILSKPALRGFLIKFREHLGSGGEAMLYHIGREVGAERGRHIDREAEKMGIKRLRDKFIMGEILFKSLGYGIPQITEFSDDPPYLKMRVYHCIECELGHNVGRPFSHYVRGVIAGFASEIFNREMLAKETRCIAMGDPYCEFEAKPKEISRRRGW